MRFVFSFFLTASFLLLSPTSADAQSRSKTKSKGRGVVSRVSIKAPQAPTPLDVRERTVKDILFFPYATLKEDINDSESAKRLLTETFGSWEPVNGLFVGIHAGEKYNYTYQGVPISHCYADWDENRNWYNFYFDTLSEAQYFYTHAVADLKKAGLPMTNDKVYGGMSNRRQPVSIFKWVYVSTPAKVNMINSSNIDHPDAEGKYKVELGVYKRAAR